MYRDMFFSVTKIYSNINYKILSMIYASILHLFTVPSFTYLFISSKLIIS